MPAERETGRNVAACMSRGGKALSIIAACTLFLLGGAIAPAFAVSVLSVEVSVVTGVDLFFLAPGPNGITLTNLLTPPFVINFTASTQAPDVLNTTLQVMDNTTTTTNELNVRVRATNLTTVSGVQNVLSSLNKVDLTAGWLGGLATFYSLTIPPAVPGTFLASTVFSPTSTSNSKDVVTPNVDFGAGPVAFTVEYGIGTLDLLGQANLSANITVPAPVPLPTALPLFASGLVGLLLLGWRRKKKAAAG
jgi:hypothetical protein